MNDANSASDSGETPKVSRWWNVAVALGAVAVIGTYAASLIPAYVGTKTGNPFSSLYIVFWTGLLGYFIRKQRGLSGGYGWLIGGAVGVIVVIGSGFLYGYQKAQLENEALIAAAEANITDWNEQLPQMVDDSLRADRIAFGGTGMQMFFTFIDATAEELDSDLVRREYKDYYVSIVCETAELEEALAIDAVMSYYLRDKDGNPVVDFTIKAADCQ